MEELKVKVEEIVNKVKNDGDFANKFQENPLKAVEGVVGVNLPEEQINGIIQGVKAKINFDNNDIVGKIKGLF